tara:strand:- start:1205 stop:2518 length:1314 start_codon:yes stop_codon:yes gene_type:complete
MGGSQMQLVAYGAQDIYLTGNPQMSFFKVVYRRHTNFSMEAIQQGFEGHLTAEQSTLDAILSKNGDLLYRMWLDVKMVSQNASGNSATDVYSNWTNNTGHAFVKECGVEIGGQLIDHHYSQWLDVWNELTDHEESEWTGLNKNSAKNSYLKSDPLGANRPLQLYIPLQFWFCRNPGLALPLIALQYQVIKVKLTTRSMNGLINKKGMSITPAAPTCDLYCDYIYLDTDERRRFAQVSHEYLIEQVQREKIVTNNGGILNLDLIFNHPVKELIWTAQSPVLAEESTTSSGEYTDATKNASYAAGSGGSNNDYFNYGYYGDKGTAEHIGAANNPSYEAFDFMKLQLNGCDRFSKRKATYFRICQPQQHGHKVPSKHIYCYSFALKPEEHQPSGTCNFSRIDNVQMQFDTLPTDTAITVWAINYNVLRIMSGMAGLSYSS